MTNKLTPSEWEYLKIELQLGSSISEMAKENNISRASIYQYGNRNWGWKKKRKGFWNKILSKWK